MSERVQQLMHEVRRAAAEPDYKEPLGHRFPDAHQQVLQAVQREVTEEIAYSLGKAGAKIERAIRTLNGLLEQSRAVALSLAERAELEAAFQVERLLAERYLRDLLIQREALGFRRHDDVRQRWVLPRWS